MKSPNNGGDRVPTGYLLSANEGTTTGIGIHLTELLAKVIPWESSNNPGCSQDYRMLFTNRQASPHCWRQHLHNSLNMEKFCWCLDKAFIPMFHHLWYRKVPFILPKKKCKHQSRCSFFVLQWWPAWKILVQWWHKACGITNQCLIWL